jgi:hypothetical protein
VVRLGEGGSQSASNKGIEQAAMAIVLDERVIWLDSLQVGLDTGAMRDAARANAHLPARR